MKTEDEITHEQNQANALPVCPHCGTDPLVVTMKQMKLGPAQVAFLFCGNLECRKVFTVQVLGMEQPRVLDMNGRGLLRPS